MPSRERLDPFLDPAIGVVAAALALASLLDADMGALDPRLHEPDVLSAVATVVAAGSLAWRRRRPRASYAVFLAGALVVSGSFHYIGLLSRADAAQPVLAGDPRPRGATRLSGWGWGWRASSGLRWRGCRTCGPRTCCWPSPCSWRPGRWERRSGPGGSCSATRCGRPITEERLRIARELHDVVAHSMSLIAVQAGVGAHVIRTDPASAEQALEVIADTSRKALEQTRSMLGHAARGGRGRHPPADPGTRRPRRRWSRTSAPPGSTSSWSGRAPRRGSTPQSR